MKYSIVALVAASGLMLSLPAFADDSGDAQVKEKVSTGSDGSYSEKGSASSSNTDANGTYTSEDKSVKANIDANGNGKKTVKKTSITDPKGLFNKKKTITTDTQTMKDGKTQTDHEMTVNGSTVEKSSTTTDSH